MEWGNLSTAALAVSAATLFMRWRLPTLHPVLASSGVCASLAVAVLSLFHPSVELTISVALNAALAAGAVDYAIGRRKQSGSDAVDSLLELRIHGDGRIPTGIQTINIWRWFTLDLTVVAINNETGEHTDNHIATVLFVTFERNTTTRNLSISSPDMSLPRYEVKDFCPKSAIISFQSALSPGLLFVRTHH